MKAKNARERYKGIPETNPGARDRPLQVAGGHGDLPNYPPHTERTPPRALPTTAARR